MITCLSVSSIIATTPLQMIVISISVESVVVDAHVMKLEAALSMQTNIHRVVFAVTISQSLTSRLKITKEREPLGVII
mgnify:CR=1 FL=1